MTRNPSRRALLGGLAGAATLAPFVPVTSRAAEAGPIRRLVLLFTPHGTVRDAWLPTGSETGFALPTILAPLERHRDHLVVLDGLRIDDASVGAPHTKGSPLLWTASPLIEDQTFSRDDGNGVYYYGWNSGPSIDQVIADALNPPTPWRSLELGVINGHISVVIISFFSERPALFSQVFVEVMDGDATHVSV